MTRTVDELIAMANVALRACPAPEVEVWVRGSALGHLRFAAGGVSTSGAAERVEISVTAGDHGRAATASSEDVTPDGIKRVAARAADFAKLVPPSPERLPPVGPQSYPRAGGWDAGTAGSDPAARAARAKAALDVAKAAGLVAAGYLEDSEELVVFANSAGAAGHGRSTTSSFSTTLRTKDGRQSGWAGASAVRAADLDAAALAKRAADKAAKWSNPTELPPGRYVAILEPAAAAELVGMLPGSLDRRRADEGRSCFSKEGGATRVGETMFAPALTLAADPADKRIPGSPFGEDGLAAKPLVAIDHGKLASLVTSRYWAKSKKLAPTPTAGNWSFSFAEPVADLDALVTGVERAVLVTRIWYVRMLDRKTLTVTGLTRDATFLVEDGKVTQPVKNFRLNQSVLELLANVEAATAPTLQGGLGVPGLRVKDFGFSSVSDAV